MSSSDTTRRSSMAGVASVMSMHGTGNSSSNNVSASGLSTINSRTKPTIITPRIQENSLGEALQHRTQILSDFKELGQADLVHLSKYEKSVKQEIGEYHYVTGINTMDVIQPFMYLQTIQLNDKEPATHKHMKVGTYCCYNIFSKGDMRIRCQFPGSASPMIQFVPANKQSITITINKDDEKNRSLWIETYVSSLIRSILLPDSIERQLPGMCKFNPIQSTKDAKEAVELMCRLLHRGHETGCSDAYNRPSLVNNFLVDALLKLLSIVKYHDVAIQEIEKLMESKRINLNVICVKILLLKNDNAKAVRLMHDCLKHNPRDGWMLNEQAAFLLDENRPDLALMPSMIAVECLPSEFLVWKNLILNYIMRDDMKNALLALNSAPMYTNKRKDIYAAIRPKAFDFPFPLEGKIDSVWRDCESFGCISGIGGIVEFSTAAEVNKVSKFRLRVYEETKLNYTFKEAYDLLAYMSKKCGWGSLLKIRSDIFVMEDEYNQEVQGRKEDIKENGQSIPDAESVTETETETNGTTTATATTKTSSSSLVVSSKFKSKRLSEKWLDSLFLIFYENLKNVLIYQNDLVSKGDVQFCPCEWELIGEECFKVHYYEDGLKPFETCMSNRFSIFASYRLLNHFLECTQHPKLYDALNETVMNEADDEEVGAAVELHSPGRLTEDEVIRLCCQLMSWSARFYGEFPVVCMQILDTLMRQPECDSTVLKSKIEYMLLDLDAEQRKSRGAASASEKTLLRDMDGSQGMVGVSERILAWLAQFSDE